MDLVDTSVWIEVFRARRPLDLESVTAFDDVVTCLPIVQEILQGIKEEGAYRLAHDALFALPLVGSPLRAELFVEATNLYRSARRTGLTIRSSVDCLIAACALRHDLRVVHKDRDFTALARVSSLRQVRL